MRIHVSVNDPRAKVTIETLFRDVSSDLAEAGSASRQLTGVPIIETAGSGNYGGHMLKMLKRRQARFIALLAQVARDERDALLGNVSEKDLGEPKPARGEHNPTAALGLEPLPRDSAQVSALQEAIVGLSPPARSELYTLMRIGQGHLGAKDWDRGIAETELIGDQAITASLTDNVDLHDHLLKGLYELRIAA